MTVFAKKEDHFKRLKKRQNPTFFCTNVPIQRMLFFYLIFLNLFLLCLLLSLVDESIFVTVGIQKKRRRKEIAGRRSFTSARAVILKLKWPVEQVFTLSLIQNMLSR